MRHAGTEDATVPVKMSLAVRQADAELYAARLRYPERLPASHLAALRGWSCPLKVVNGVLARYGPDEFITLSPLSRAFEVNRCFAEAMLALARAGETRVSEQEREDLTRHAHGIRTAQWALSMKPEYAGAWHNLGIVYRDTGRQQLAVEAIEIRCSSTRCCCADPALAYCSNCRLCAFAVFTPSSTDQTWSPIPTRASSPPTALRGPSR